MKELAVISGKGGTGKTSIVASFAALAAPAVLADCDVDAADLHLVLDPRVLRSETFVGGKQARIITDNCVGCRKCIDVCRFDAVSFDGPGNGAISKTCRVNSIACEGCGLCAWFCPADAVDFGPVAAGEWFVSETRHGPMVHARLGVAAENSGKLVSTVRQAARDTAEARRLDLIIVDGSPGIGCPVIASVTGADLLLIVTEPTVSGAHDLTRVAELAAHFGLATMVCVNKWDLNPEVAAQIESLARDRGMKVAGRVRYDRAVTEAQIRRLSVVEHSRNGSSDDIRAVWHQVRSALDTATATGDAGDD